jgi:4'-phosphopantetheinyl transferase
MMQLFFMDLSVPIDPSRYDVLLSLLPAERQMEISGFRFAEDRRMRVMADVLVRCRISQMLRVPFADLRMEKSEYGKPYLLHDTSIHFNISHTRSAIAAGFSDEPIGVDVERITRCDMRIAQRVFTKNECEYVFEDQKLQDERFFDIWTKKEAYMKWTGSGFHTDPCALDVLTGSGLCPEARLFSRKIQDYNLSCCSALHMEQMEVQPLSEQELYSDCIT